MRINKILGVDVEARGPNFFLHGLVSVGLCLVDAATGNVDWKRRISIKPADFGRGMQTFEEDCRQQFWSRHEEKLQEFEQEAVSASEAARMIHECMLAAVAAAADKLVVVSDYKDFDLAQINNLLEYCDYPSFRFYPTDSSRLMPTIDTDSYQSALQDGALFPSDKETLIKIKAPLTTTLAHHDHYPENDAQHIAEMYWLVHRVRVSVLAAEID